MRSTILLILILLATSANAYVGPGLGLGALGALFGAIVTVLLAIFRRYLVPDEAAAEKEKECGSEERGDRPR